MPKNFNLDDGIEESFAFTVLGNSYSFKYPNTEELEAFSKLGKEDVDKLGKMLLEYITPIGESKPFDQIQKKMLPPHVVKFNKMVMEEIGGIKE